MSKVKFKTLINFFLHKTKTNKFYQTKIRVIRKFVKFVV
jgi:hypothetical protein